MDDLTRDALLALRAEILRKGWRMREYDWARIHEIDLRLRGGEQRCLTASDPARSSRPTSFA